MKHMKEHLLTYGAQTLSTAELLAYLLTTGSSRKDGVAQFNHLLENHTLRQLRNADVAELCTMGLSLAQAQRLHAYCALIQRFEHAEIHDPSRIRSAEDAVALLRPLMMHLEHETFRVLCLNTKNCVLANIEKYSGTVNSSVLRAAEVFKPAIARNCTSIIVAHNHPSGDPTPSPEDCEVSLQLCEAGKLLDIELLDHLIIGNPRYVSLKEQLRF